MRTTLTIDDDVLDAARRLASERSVSVGRALSDLVRLGLRSLEPMRFNPTTGFPVFTAPPDAQPITPEDVARANDEW